MSFAGTVLLNYLVWKLQRLQTQFSEVILEINSLNHCGNQGRCTYITYMNLKKIFLKRITQEKLHLHAHSVQTTELGHAVPLLHLSLIYPHTDDGIFQHNINKSPRLGKETQHCQKPSASTYRQGLHWKLWSRSLPFFSSNSSLPPRGWSSLSASPVFSSRKIKVIRSWHSLPGHATCLHLKCLYYIS